MRGTSPVLVSPRKTPTGREEAELDDLVAACLAFDGFARLERESSLNAHPEMPGAFLARRGERLVGALTIFQPKSSEAEIGALVSPAARRSGVFRALLDAAEGELARFGPSTELFVLDSRSASGKALAAKLGAIYDFTEYAMRYAGGDPPHLREGMVIARAGMEHLEALAELRESAFGGSREEELAFQRTVLSSPDREEYIARIGSEIVGACSLGYEGARVSVNGLVVSASARGKGIGRGLLSEALRSIRAKGLEAVLEVESRNASALRLYEGMGFVAERAVEYHRRPFPAH